MSEGTYSAPGNDGDNVIVENDTGDVTDWNIEGGKIDSASGTLQPGQSETITRDPGPAVIQFTQTIAGKTYITSVDSVAVPQGNKVLTVALRRFDQGRGSGNLVRFFGIDHSVS